MDRTRIPALAVALALALAVPAARASHDLALVLNGNDNSLSTAALAGGPGMTGQATFAGYPGEGTLAGDRYYAVVSGADHVVVFDAGSLAPVDTLFPGPGTNPYACAVDDAGNVFVTLLLANEVVRFDASGAETGRTAVGRSPQGVLLHDGELWVANTGFRFSDFGYDPGSLYVLDPAALAVVDSAAVGLNPQWIDAADGEIHAVCTGNYFSVFGEAHVVDAATRASLGTVPLGASPGHLVLDGGFAYTADYFGGIFRYRVSDRAVLNDAASPIAFGGRGYSRLAADGEGALYVTLFEDDLLARLETTGYTVDAVFPTGDGPGSVVLRDPQPVPVTLTAYAASAGPGGVTLSWTAADDRTVAAWFVERSAGGDDAWSTVARLAPDATRHTDAGAPAGTVRYRLGAVERDGTVTRFAARTVTVRPGLAVRPAANPVRGSLTFSLSGADAALPVVLVDARGRAVRSTRASGEGRFDVSGLAGGVYFLRAGGGSAAATARVVVLP